MIRRSRPEPGLDIREIYKGRIQPVTAKSRAACLLTGSSILSVQAHWTETTVGKRGELVLEGVPFEPGQPVEVLVVSKAEGSTPAGGRSLRDSVVEFHEPLDPVASEDWDALQ